MLGQYSTTRVATGVFGSGGQRGGRRRRGTERRPARERFVEHRAQRIPLAAGGRRQDPSVAQAFGQTPLRHEFHAVKNAGPRVPPLRGCSRCWNVASEPAPLPCGSTPRCRVLVANKFQRDKAIATSLACRKNAPPAVAASLRDQFVIAQLLRRNGFTGVRIAREQRRAARPMPRRRVSTFGNDGTGWCGKARWFRPAPTTELARGRDCSGVRDHAHRTSARGIRTGRPR